MVGLRNKMPMGKMSPMSIRKVSRKVNLNASLRSSASVSRSPLKGRPIRKPAMTSANIKVLVRVRPPNKKEIDNNVRHIVKVVDDKMLIFDPKIEEDNFFFHGVRQKGRDMLKKENKNAEFIFDNVYGFDSTNEHVFETGIKDTVSSVLDGYNCSVFVYGATGAGKTFTMLGRPDNPGITFRAMVSLFEAIEAQKSEKIFDIGVSYLEIYNETVHDLISPSQALHLREDGGKVMVAGLKMEKIKDANKMFEILESGNKNRTQHPTDANAESSRSHAVFQVYIKMTMKSTSQVKLVKLSMIDLAGSERGAATGCAGARFKEGSNINKSLLALGNCINALADGLSHIPYRDSKLTRLLKDSLGGNCKTVMIANVSPAASTFEDTHNTLKYAKRAKKIKTKIKTNVVLVGNHVESYVHMVENLQAENADLKKELAEAKALIEQYKSGAATNSTELVAVGNITSSTDSTVLPQIVVEQDEKLQMLVKRAQTLYEEKESLQKRYLSMDSSEKITQWRAQHKQRSLNRTLQLDSTPQRNESEIKVTKSLNQFKGRLLAANECQQLLSLEERESDKKLEQLKREVEQLGLLEEFDKQFEIPKLKYSLCETRAQLNHYYKLLSLLNKESEDLDQLVSMVCPVLRYYHKLLLGHKLMTESMNETYENIQRQLRGVKGVNWVENVSASFEDSSALHKVAKLSICGARSPPVSSGKSLECASIEPTEQKIDISNEVLNSPKRLLSPPPPQREEDEEEVANQFCEVNTDGAEQNASSALTNLGCPAISITFDTTAKLDTLVDKVDNILLNTSLMNEASPSKVNLNSTFGLSTPPTEHHPVIEAGPKSPTENNDGTPVLNRTFDAEKPKIVHKQQPVTSSMKRPYHFAKPFSLPQKDVKAVSTPIAKPRMLMEKSVKAGPSVSSTPIASGKFVPNRRIVGSAKKMLTTPSKTSYAWNKENNNALKIKQMTRPTKPAVLTTGKGIRNPLIAVRKESPK